MYPWIIEKIRQERQEERRIQPALPAPEPPDRRRPGRTSQNPGRGSTIVDYEIKT